MEAPRSVRVVIADDHKLFAEALEAILGKEGQISIVGRASNGQEAVALAAASQPDVVLMDISMPILDGLAATSQIREVSPETQVLVLTGSAAASDIQQARAAGAAGYVTKDRIAAELVSAILSTVAEGEVF